MYVLRSETRRLGCTQDGDEEAGMYSDQRQGGRDALRLETRRSGCIQIGDKEAGMYSDRRLNQVVIQL